MFYHFLLLHFYSTTKQFCFCIHRKVPWLKDYKTMMLGYITQRLLLALHCSHADYSSSPQPGLCRKCLQVVFARRDAQQHYKPGQTIRDIKVTRANQLKITHNTPLQISNLVQFLLYPLNTSYNKYPACKCCWGIIYNAHLHTGQTARCLHTY